MTRAEKFTAIYNAFKAIKNAIISKGVTVSGDISTFADAISSIPVGSQVVTGQVSGSGNKTLTITDAIGKDNIVVFLISTTTSTLSVSTVVGTGFVNGTMYMTYKSSSNIIKASNSASYSKTNGQIAYTGTNSYVFSDNANIKYIYIAW